LYKRINILLPDSTVAVLDRIAGRPRPYAVVRHPIYTSLFATMMATGLLLTRWPLLLLAAALYLAGTEIRIRAEESLLRARFGDPFEEYRRRVPAYLPFVR
jgi:protein-S-isoprenylcysteine O-methyltransferase Ste14